MIAFSLSKKAFYDSELNYEELPADLLEVTAEQHIELLTALNSACIIFKDLTYSEPKPSQFHEWSGSRWVDNRTAEEIAEYERSLLPPLTPIEFDIKLVDAGIYEQVQDLIQSDVKLKIAYTRATFFSRTDPFIDQARIALNLTDEQADAIWEQALTL